MLCRHATASANKLLGLLLEIANVVHAVARRAAARERGCPNMAPTNPAVKLDDSNEPAAEPADNVKVGVSSAAGGKSVKIDDVPPPRWPLSVVVPSALAGLFFITTLALSVAYTGASGAAATAGSVQAGAASARARASNTAST